MCWCSAPSAAAAGRAPSSPGVAKVLHCRGRRSMPMAWPSRWPRCWWRWRPATRTCWRPARRSARTSCRASPRCSTCSRSATSPAWSMPTPSCGRSMPATRWRPCSRPTRRRCITVRAASFDPAAAEGGSAAIEAGAGRRPTPALSRFVGAEIVKSERPELTAARVVVSGGRAMGSAENFNILDEHRRQARRRRRRLARRGRCRLRAERPPGRPDRQDRGAGALHRLRHLGRHPAPGRA